MDLHAGKIVINGAPSQLDRWLAALDPGYVDVDGRSFVALLDFPLQFARLIHFYDLTNEIDGDWVVFFAQDPTMILAAIIALDTGRLEANFLALDRETIAARGEHKFDLLCRLFAPVVALARDINGWLEALGP